MTTLTVHHLQISQSERIPWLCEELNIPYNLKNYKRAPLLAPAEYKALHPSGAAPVIQDGDVTLAESGACVEYIAHKYGNGRLFIKPSDPAYADFLYWWHWSNGTFQPAISRAMLIRATGLKAEDSRFVANANNRLKGSLSAIDARLSSNTWLAGSEFSVADIMVVFSLSTMRYFIPYSLEDYPNLIKYLGRVGQREAYQKAMKKSDPDLQVPLGAEPPKPLV